jgi:hypothetical protein
VSILALHLSLIESQGALHHNVQIDPTITLFVVLAIEVFLVWLIGQSF